MANISLANHGHVKKLQFFYVDNISAVWLRGYYSYARTRTTSANMHTQLLKLNILNWQPLLRFAKLFGVSVSEMTLEKHGEFLPHLTLLNVVRILLLLIIVVFIGYCAKCKMEQAESKHL